MSQEGKNALTVFITGWIIPQFPSIFLILIFSSIAYKFGFIDQAWNLEQSIWGFWMVHTAALALLTLLSFLMVDYDLRPKIALLFWILYSAPISLVVIIWTEKKFG